MNKKTLLAAMMVALVTFAAAGCSSNQEIKTDLPPRLDTTLS